MIKINKSHVLLIALFTAALVIMGSCAKPECRTSADCLSKTCTLSRCDSGKCAYTPQSSCCGNEVKESVESGKPGNQCTCQSDYGKCEGKGKIKIGSREEDAQYVKYYCSPDNQCVLGVEKKDIAPQNFLDLMNTGFFKASSVIKYNKPFDAGRDTFEFTITLDDMGKELILPIFLTKAKVLYSSEYARAEQLIAEKDIDSVLNGVGDKSSISMPLTLSYKPQEIEEAGSIRYSIDYTYKKQVASGRKPSGENIYTNETVRATFTAPVKPVFLFRSS